LDSLNRGGTTLDSPEQQQISDGKRALPRCSSGAIRILAWLILAQLILLSANAAQPSPRRLGITPSDQPLEVPALEPADSKPPVTQQPAAPPESPSKERETIRRGPKVFINEIQLNGNTIFSRSDLAQITASYENRSVTNEELQELRHALTLYYVDRGYINSGAVIPDQQVVKGVVKIQIVEGRLTEILIDGNERLRAEYIKERLNLGAGPPLNINKLQSQIQIVLQDPNIEIINGALRPGDRPGEAKLEARVKERAPYDLYLFADNQLSPSLGDLRGVLQGSIYNMTGWGDSLTAEFDFAEGLNEYFLNYSIPVNKWDTRIDLWIDKSDSAVQEKPFDELDIEGEASTLSLGIAHPFYRTPQQRFEMGLGIEIRRSRTYLLGEGFAFSAGVSSDGRSKITVIRFSQDWLDRRANQVVAARSSFRFGIDAFDATINESGPDGEYLSWLGQFQWIRRMGEAGDQLHFRTHLQLTSAGLLPMEQFTVGGLRCSRGYRKNELVRDAGYCASLEYRIPILRNQTGQTLLQLAPFGDIGGAWFKDRDTPSPRNLASLGVGLLWDPHPKVHGELYWGYALEDVDHPTTTAQDNGIHFLLSMDLY